jgi:hypothetical protein
VAQNILMKLLRICVIENSRLDEWKKWGIESVTPSIVMGDALSPLLPDKILGSIH